MQSCSYPKTLWVRTTLYFTRLFFKQKLHGNSERLSKILGNAPPLINAHYFINIVSEEPFTFISKGYTGCHYMIIMIMLCIRNVGKWFFKNYTEIEFFFHLVDYID